MRARPAARLDARPLAALVAALALLTGARAEAQGQALGEARFCLIDAETPPRPAPDDPRCEPVRLPDRWSRTRPRAGG
ncbi:MAG TPA: hypothetical protein RMI62_09425, partial [Polyangiaceae bacterium LLY-WYZ-15_(1-7)]|nr:hypothetical protein [Polyangiaceae bacterium LLY-WYZ-15_(1-7)]